MNVWDKGTFSFSESTDENIEKHDLTSTEDPTTGTWSSLKNSTSSETEAAEKYSVTFDTKKLSQKKVTAEAPAVTYDDLTQAEASSLTTDDGSEHEWNANTMYLLPQEIESWVPTTNAKPAAGKGSYFLVKAKIWNVAAGDGHRATADDVYLWGSSSETKDIAIPIPAITWKPGKRYVYTFVFTTSGNGGYNPYPSGSDPEPVLTPITLSVTVDDFVKGEDKDVDMTTKP